MKFIDYFSEHGDVLHVPDQPWELCDQLARFLGFGYSREWPQNEVDIRLKNGWVIPYRMKAAVNLNGRQLDSNNQNLGSRPTSLRDGFCFS